MADVDKSTGQMTPDDIEVCCKKFKLKNVKALVVMYNGGYPQNADKFYKLKKVIHKDSSIKIDRSLLHKKFYNSFNFKIKNWQKLIKELNDDYKINKKLLYQK